MHSHAYTKLTTHTSHCGLIRRLIILSSGKARARHSKSIVAEEQAASEATGPGPEERGRKTAGTERYLPRVPVRHIVRGHRTPVIRGWRGCEREGARCRSHSARGVIARWLVTCARVAASNRPHHHYRGDCDAWPRWTPLTNQLDDGARFPIIQRRVFPGWTPPATCTLQGNDNRAAALAQHLDRDDSDLVKHFI